MKKLLTTTAATLTMIGASPAWAQAGTQELMAMDVSQLRAEIQQRYDAALARTVDPAIVNANDTRFNWANEAKVQCGIAIGFLKSSTKDETSISNCVMAAGLMDQVRTAAPPPPPTRPALPEVCSQKIPGIVFFEFDSADLPADARNTVEFVSTNAGPCGWAAFDVVGHADRAGTDAYNVGLSERRAQVVASLMTSLGIPQSAIATSARGEANPRVPTEDGVRNPQNRRVEIGVR